MCRATRGMLRAPRSPGLHAYAAADAAGAEIVEAVLDGRQPEGKTLPGLMEPFPVEWRRQQAVRG